MTPTHSIHSAVVIEYLFRRPLRLMLYAVVCFGILIVVGLLAEGVTRAAISVVTATLGLSGSPPQVALISGQILRLFPTVVLLTLLWSLVGGVYLLLRYDAGGQEVEDLWQPPPPVEPTFPKVPLG